MTEATNFIFEFWNAVNASLQSVEMSLFRVVINAFHLYQARLERADIPLKLKRQIYQLNEHNRHINPNWREADQLAIYKHDRRVERRSTEKQIHLSDQSKT